MRSIVTWLALALASAAIVMLLYRTQPGLRRRVRLAFWVVTLGYGGLFVLRLAQTTPNQERLTELGAVFAGLGALWLALWLLARRKGNQAS